MKSLRWFLDYFGGVQIFVFVVVIVPCTVATILQHWWAGLGITVLAVPVMRIEQVRWQRKQAARAARWEARDVLAQLVASDNGQDELKLTREQFRTIVRVLLG
jgi:hypothetical protein